MNRFDTFAVILQLLHRPINCQKALRWAVISPQFTRDQFQIERFRLNVWLARRVVTVCRISAQTWWNNELDQLEPLELFVRCGRRAALNRPLCKYIAIDRRNSVDLRRTAAAVADAVCRHDDRASHLLSFVKETDQLWRWISSATYTSGLIAYCVLTAVVLHGIFRVGETRTASCTHPATPSSQWCDPAPQYFRQVYRHEYNDTPCPY